MLRKRKLRFESLENRQMMAGDVTAAVAGGVLTITGDTAANDISLLPTGIANTFLVRGNNGTTVNMAAGFLAVGVTSDVTIDLDDGDDILSVNNVVLPANLNIVDSFAGTNTVNLGVGGSILVKGNISYVDTSGAVNAITANVVQSTGSQYYQFAGDASFLKITRGSSVGATTIDMQDSGNVQIDISDFYSQGVLGISSFGGPSNINGIRIGTGGNMSIQTENANIDLNTIHVRGTLFINDSDASSVSIQASVIDGSTVISMSGTADSTVTFANNVAKTVSISTFNGDDIIIVSASDIDRLFVYAGSGNDNVVVQSTILHRYSQIDAGSGFDSVSNGGTGFSPQLSLSNFSNGPTNFLLPRIVRV